MGDPQRLGEVMPKAEVLVERMATIGRQQMARLPELAEVEDRPLAPDWRTERWNAAIPNRFRWATVDKLKLGPARADLVTWAEHAEHPVPNLVLYGPTGTGKTWAAVAAARAHFERGSEVRFCPVVELLDDLRPGGDPDLWARVVHDTDVLILDDLGAHKATEWADERLYAIVNRRWLDERPTIATTNHDPDSLRDSIGERMFSRLCGGDAVVLGMTGADLRLTGP